MISDEASCSDCKIEIIEKRWTQLLLNWINKCVSPNNNVKELNTRSLVEIIDRYKNDFCSNDIDRAILCTDDVEPFIRYKYPIFRLRYFSEDKDQPRKLYMMTTILLFHCCIHSQEGLLDRDIYSKLSKPEQEMILKFCETLNDMEITINNTDCAIMAASEHIHKTAWRKLDEETTEADSFITSSKSTIKASIATLPSDGSKVSDKPRKYTTLKFKSSVTVMPSVITDTSTYSDIMSSFVMNDESKAESDGEKDMYTDSNEINVFNLEGTKREDYVKEDSTEKTYANGKHREEMIAKLAEKLCFLESLETHCKPECSCSNCILSGPGCGDPGSSMDHCQTVPEEEKPAANPVHKFFRFGFPFDWKIYLLLVGMVMLIILMIVLLTVPFKNAKKTSKILVRTDRFHDEIRYFYPNSWHCKNNLCQKLSQPTNSDIYISYSRCALICMGPQLWPLPIGSTYYSKEIVALATNKLEYKFQSIPSETVHQYLAEAFKLFLGDLARLERVDAKPRNHTQDLTVMKMNIQIYVESDPNPRLTLNTEEAYSLTIETNSDQVMIKIVSDSFCGVRHGLETLSQLILLDQSTGLLITLTDVVINDGPSYKYRGLMIDTGRNYIPVPDLMRTIDAMATCKINTFHWRISDVTSFPLLLPKLPQLFQYGGYARSLVYTKKDVTSIVNRAGIRGIRVLIEVAAPGPVGRAWSWSPDASCPTKTENSSCDNILCLRLDMKDSILNILQEIYTEIIEMTHVDDIFHLSDSVFSLTNCYFLIEDREGFLEKALERLKIANKGFLPKLPIIWFTKHLTRDFEARTWEKKGVQLTEWQQGSTDQFLSKFKVIHSSKWDLSCDIKKQRCKKYRTWQEMYAWKSWRNIEVFTIEGGEAILWTDLVNSDNLDYHLWPRVAAVAERLWSDIIVNTSATAQVYARLDSHRWRMLLKAVKVQPIWPVWCNFNAAVCSERIP